MTTKKAQSIDTVAASLGLETVGSKDAVRDIFFSILRSTYRYMDEEDRPVLKELVAFGPEEEKKAMLERIEKDNEEIQKQIENFEKRLDINRRIEEVFKKHTGQDWIDDRKKVISSMLIGPPGHGKTSIIKEAARQAATELGMKFLENPTDDKIIDLDTFVFTSMEFSGENSKMELSGIPAKGKVQGIDTMVHLNNWRLGSLTLAGASQLLLDDFTNATSNIQNVGLSITDEKRYQGTDLRNVNISLTGNLGSIDGTNTSNASTALGSRVKTAFIRDNIKDFSARVQSQFQDELGDLGILGFLSNHEQLFAQLPDARTKGGFPCPRSWENFIVDIRRLVQEVGGRQNAMQALGRIQSSAGQFLGQEVKIAVGTYIHAMLSSADPLAREVIMEGKLDMNVLKNRYDEGFSAKSQHFAFQYTQSLAQYAVTRIIKDGSLDAAITNFAKGIAPIDSQSLAASIDTLAHNLAMRKPEYSSPKGNEGRALNMDIKQQIAKIIAQTKAIDADQRDVIVAALSDADKYEATSSVRQRRAS